MNPTPRLVNKDTLRHDLDFCPRRAPSALLPAFGYGGWIIQNFGSQIPVAVDLTDLFSDFTTAFHACHSELRLGELARFFRSIEGLVDFPRAERPDWPSFFQRYRLGWDTNLQRTLEILGHLPEEFVSWTIEKDVGARDLAPLRAFDKNLSVDLSEGLRLIVEWGASKSVGVRLLELMVDLELMGVPWRPTFTSEMRIDEVHDVLKRLRYPETTARDLGKNLWIKQITWPNSMSVKPERRGDASGIEVKLWADSREDLDRRLKAIQEMISL